MGTREHGECQRIEFQDHNLRETGRSKGTHFTEYDRKVIGLIGLDRKVMGLHDCRDWIGS